MSSKNQYEKPGVALAYLDHLADAIGCHPRTILRAVTGNPTEYWAPSHNPRLRIADVAKRYQVPKKALIDLLTGADKVFPPAETADLLEISVRTLRAKDKYKPLIIGAGFLRFSNADIDRWYIELEAARREKINKLF